jgi:hypothetical protein
MCSNVTTLYFDIERSSNLSVLVDSSKMSSSSGTLASDDPDVAALLGTDAQGR